MRSMYVKWQVHEYRSIFEEISESVQNMPKLHTHVPNSHRLKSHGLNFSVVFSFSLFVLVFHLFWCAFNNVCYLVSGARFSPLHEYFALRHQSILRASSHINRHCHPFSAQKSRDTQFCTHILHARRIEADGPHLLNSSHILVAVLHLHFRQALRRVSSVCWPKWYI